MSGRHQIVHSQVLHDLPIVIPSVREENRRCIESCSSELLDVRISYLFQQVRICQGADCPMCMRECIPQIPDDILLAGQVSGPLLIRVRKHRLTQQGRGDLIKTEGDVSSSYSKCSHVSNAPFLGMKSNLLAGIVSTTAMTSRSPAPNGLSKICLAFGDTSAPNIGKPGKEEVRIERRRHLICMVLVVLSYSFSTALMSSS